MMEILSRAVRGATLAAAVLGAAAPVPAAAETVYSDGDVALSVSGRVQFDALSDSDVPRAQRDGAALRRARLGFGLRLFEDWRLVASGDFPERSRLRDLSLEYRGWPVRVEVGRQQEPFSLAENGSSLDTLFLERPSPTTLGPDYNLGGTLNYRGDRWGVTAGLFAASDHPQFGGDRYEDAATARFTAMPLRERVLLHLGAGVSERRSADPEGLRVRGSAETTLVSGFTPASVRDRNDDRYRLHAAEFALRGGPVLVQAEYIGLDSAGRIGGHGWYAEAGWILTGEKRVYDVRYGRFDGVTPRRPLGAGGAGAVELGLRHSRTDLAADGGDRGRISGLALNWYPSRRWRLSLNALRIALEEAGEPRRDTDLIQSRVQAYF